ncbi:unnamed protein product [Sphagnum jensenii]|uniref:Uncharacterized protein n=1 Tax=Sphagnum jensenii TaxID=128206 RepID=A0ABP1BWZ4_9BRYO
MLNKLCIPKEHGSRLHFYGLLFRNCNSSIELTVGHPHRDDQLSYKMENPEERPWLPNRERKEGAAIVDVDPEERPQICRNNKCPTWVLQIDCSECGTPTTFICLTWLLSTIL